MKKYIEMVRWTAYNNNDEELTPTYDECLRVEAFDSYSETLRDIWSVKENDILKDDATQVHLLVLDDETGHTYEVVRSLTLTRKDNFMETFLFYVKTIEVKG